MNGFAIALFLTGVVLLGIAGFKFFITGVYSSEVVPFAIVGGIGLLLVTISARVGGKQPPKQG